MELEILNKILEKVEHLDVRLNSLSSEVGSLSVRVDSLSSEVSSLRSEMNEKFDMVDARFEQLQESVNRIETTQQEDVLSILDHIHIKFEDTAKKSDIVSFQADIEFIVKENSLFTLELDRLKRHVFA
ncbi:MAG: hypothetical protein WD469_04720 [Paenibacillaceae bacterium]